MPILELTLHPAPPALFLRDGDITLYCDAGPPPRGVMAHNQERSWGG